MKLIDFHVIHKVFVLLKIKNTLRLFISHLHFYSKHHDKSKFALTLVNNFQFILRQQKIFPWHQTTFILSDSYVMVSMMSLCIQRRKLRHFMFNAFEQIILQCSLNIHAYIPKAKYFFQMDPKNMAWRYIQHWKSRNES